MPWISTVGVAQQVRALGCGPRGCRFESDHSPHADAAAFSEGGFFIAFSEAR